MNDNNENKPEATPPTPSDETSGAKGMQPPPPSDPGRGNGVSSSSWFATHGRDLRFLAVFGVLMGIYYWGTTTEAVDKGFFPWYLVKTTSASADVLNLFGYDDVTAEGTNLVGSVGSVGSISVARGCDAVAPTALFVSAVLASPASIGSKLLAVVCGTLILMVVNLIRIVTLFLTAVYWPRIFDAMHLDVWQAVFIFLAILLWALWASWASRRRKRRSHAAA